MEQGTSNLRPDLVHNQEVSILLARATPERKKIFEKLQEKEWFQKSDPLIQKQLLALPDRGRENHDGFLKDLAARKEEIANIKVERMVDLPRGSYALVPKFEVSRIDNPSLRYTYEYVSWRTGPLSGAKGVVFVEKEGQTTHFIVLRGEKFAPAKKTFDAIGGFIDKGFDGVTSLNERTVREIQQELGVPKLDVSRVVNLGNVLPDAGMTNNEPSLFAAFISDKDLGKISSTPVNPDVHELKSGAVIFPMADLPKIVMNNNDGYFLSTIARAWAKGIIAPPVGYSGKSSTISS